MNYKRFEIWDVLIYVSLIFLTVGMLYPFLNSLAVALNDGYDTMKGGITIFPRRLTFDNLLAVFANENVYRGFFVTIMRTVIGTLLGTLLTGIAAYAMTKPSVKGRKVYLTLCIISMYFSGGIIPSYLLMDKLNLTNNFFVFIIPNIFSVFNMIIMMSFFKTIPLDIEEAAEIDGAGKFRVLFTIIMPMSMPIIAVIGLYVAVFHWNSWFDAFIYMSGVEGSKLMPLQNVLRDIINANSLDEVLPNLQNLPSQIINNVSTITSRSITAATMIITIGPIIFVYPFLQKYFVKGVLIGSLKG